MSNEESTTQIWRELRSVKEDLQGVRALLNWLRRDINQFKQQYDKRERDIQEWIESTNSVLMGLQSSSSPPTRAGIGCWPTASDHSIPSSETVTIAPVTSSSSFHHHVPTQPSALYRVPSEFGFQPLYNVSPLYSSAPPGGNYQQQQQPWPFSDHIAPSYPQVTPYYRTPPAAVNTPCFKVAPPPPYPPINFSPPPPYHPPRSNKSDPHDEGGGPKDHGEEKQNTQETTATKTKTQGMPDIK